jgi:cytidine deaminase
MNRTLTFDELEHPDQCLVESALRASAYAYAPYSGFAVGAAVSTSEEKIVAGANLENASYPLGICAEVTAISSANSQGQFRIKSIAVVGHKFTSPQDFSQVVTPCGRCRQIIFEAAQVSGCEILVFSCNATLTKIEVSPISELLPKPFGPGNLGLDKTWPGTRRRLEDIVSRLLKREHIPIPDR